MTANLSSKTKVSIAHSPDADDAFMFYALSEKLVDSKDYEIENILKDIQTLNVEAQSNKYDVQAISFHAYPELQNDYQLLSCGGSLGVGYGPTLISSEKISLEDLRNEKDVTIAIPGEKTTAFLLLKLLLNDFKFKALPFDQIIDAVKSGEYKYGLLIHEGQLSYEGHGLHLITDLGKWWQDETGLPVPLGANVIKRKFDDKTKKDINEIIRASISYGLDNQEAVIPKVTSYAREIENDIAKVDRFVSMYVNNYTVDYGEDGRKSIQVLFERAIEKGFIKEMPNLDYID